MTTGEGEHPKEELLVHFIDVGQGDGILIQQGGQNMLIDAGENNRGEDVVTYLRSQGGSVGLCDWHPSPFQPHRWFRYCN